MSAQQPPAPASSKAGLTVVCLCAGWCTACREFAPIFATLRQSHAHTHTQDRLLWIDIEDQPDVLGELDITTFPTLVIAAAGGALHFGGAAPPQQAVVARLIDAARRGPMLGNIDDELRAQYQHVITAVGQENRHGVE